MPRNVVTLVPRGLFFRKRNHPEARKAIRSYLEDRFRGRVSERSDCVEVDFPKRMGGRAAKDEVAAALDEFDPQWRRLYDLFPTEDSLREPR